MSKRISVEGKVYVVPDDATDEEINQIVGPPASPKLTENGQAVPEGGFGMGHYLKEQIPSGSDLLHALGGPANQEEAQRVNEETAAHPFRSFFKSPAASLMYGGPAIDAAIGMGKEGARGVRGMAGGDPYAGLHLASAMNPLAAPVVNEMAERGLGTREANATGLVNVAPMIAGEGAKVARPYVGEGLARTGGVLSRNAEPIGKTIGYGGAGLTAIEELYHGRPAQATAAALLSRSAANRGIGLTRGVGEGLLNLGNKVGRTPRPLFGPEQAPEGYAQYQEPTPSPYRLRGNELTDATTILPRRVITDPTRMLPASSASPAAALPRGAPSYFEKGTTAKTTVPLTKLSARGGNLLEGLRESEIHNRAVNEMNAQTGEGEDAIRTEMERPGGAWRGKESTQAKPPVMVSSPGPRPMTSTTDLLEGLEQMKRNRTRK